jgi:hypothetical protein
MGPTVKDVMTRRVAGVVVGVDSRLTFDFDDREVRARRSCAAESSRTGSAGRAATTRA